MKKMMLVSVFCILFVMVGCGQTNKEKHTTTTKEKIEKTKKQETAIPKQQGIPTVTYGDVNFDSSYDTVCWGKCKTEGFYSFPTVQEGEVKEGENIRISWKDLQPKPSKIVLLNTITNEEKELPVDTLSYDMTIQSNQNHQQFAVQFYWRQGKKCLEIPF